MMNKLCVSLRAGILQTLARGKSPGWSVTNLDTCKAEPAVESIPSLDVLRRLPVVQRLLCSDTHLHARVQFVHGAMRRRTEILELAK